MKHIAIYGALSAIAIEVARLLARPDIELTLVGRNKDQLDQLANDLAIRGVAKTNVVEADFSKAADIDSIANTINTPDIALLMWGTLPNQEDINNDIDLMSETLNINGMQAVRLAQLLANQMEVRGTGRLLALGSPAGDRGRKTNYSYGTAKAMLATTFSGLRQRLSAQGIVVTLIKPGFVKTPMTEDFDRSGPLWSEPEVIAQRIVKAFEQDKAVIYVPFYWRIIMLIIQHIPDFVFKKLNF